MTEDACRIDVWLWRARFFKTRSLAARIVEEGGVRLLRGQSRAPVDKPSRSRPQRRRADLCERVELDRCPGRSSRRAAWPGGRGARALQCAGRRWARDGRGRRAEGSDMQLKAVTLSVRAAKLKNASLTRGRHETHAPWDACRGRLLRFSPPRRAISRPPLHRAISRPRTRRKSSIGRRRRSIPSSRA